MRVLRVNDLTVNVGPLDVFAIELLHQVPVIARDDNEASTARLYPSPTDELEPEFDEEWKVYVSPDLQHLFAGSLEIMEQDLADFPPVDDSANTHTLTLPVSHLDAWVHGLNQARLALAARHGFDEDDIEGRLPFEDGHRALALFQIHLYGFLQECFLMELGDT